MHGLLLLHLKQYIGQKHPEDEAWDLLFQRARIEFVVFTPMTNYPPMIAARVLCAAAELRDEDIPTFLRGYGRYLFPELMKVYGSSFHYTNHPGDVFQLLQQMEVFYKRIRASGVMDPPRFMFEKESQRKATLHMRSSLDDIFPQICQLGHGMLDAAADHFGQRMGVKQVACVSSGDPFCSFELRPRIKSSSALPRVMEILNGDDEGSE